MFRKVLQILPFFCGSLAYFSAGLHFSWTLPSLRKIMSDEYPFPVTEDEASYIAIIGSVGHVFGGILGSTLVDKIGRKPVLLLISFPQALSFALIYFSYLGKYLLYGARTAGGIGEGATLAILPIYIAEVAAPEVRGTLVLIVSMNFVVSALFMNLVGSFYNIHVTALICMTFPILLWLSIYGVAESPYYLLMKKRTEDATRSLKILRNKNQVESELSSLTSDVNRQMSESGGFKDLFTIASNRKALMLVLCTRFFQQFTGSSAFGMYYQILIEQSTNLSPVIGSSLLLVVQIVMNILSYFLIDRFGRKPLLVMSSALTFLVLLTLGIFFVLTDYSPLKPSGLYWFPLFCMVLFVIAFYSGLGVAVNVFASEIYSTSIKSKATALGSVVFASYLMVSTKYYQFTADNVGLALPFLSFAFVTLIGVLFFYFVLPETKGKTLETIQKELKTLINVNHNDDNSIELAVR